ncbi:hypothetical protein M441DRAFT_280051 [Trichoderma asperellum CBS 433.97]|uniref:Secreted protein n=1 Tax=Trichoderma asperellum (strain ATCC 204424 / CBS 433.97 / NBRC 101777) TaxID=1042311 RepID=A0A2T3YV92_TRIA4|nr:hypothetical protein M441DRAFT_280051 [Trichoderma asperellum CBS 433.97]PTB36491.1 hypothetical protein M441DRAFT_280051 [Trichoderma asperellum CBS 433.97]
MAGAHVLLLGLLCRHYPGPGSVAATHCTAHAAAIGLRTSRRASSYVHGPALAIAWPCQTAELSASRPDSLGHLREGVMCGEPVQQKSANRELTSWFQQQIQGRILFPHLCRLFRQRLFGHRLRIEYLSTRLQHCAATCTYIAGTAYSR